MSTSTLSPPVIGVGIDTARYGHHVTFLREDCQPAAEPLAMVESRAGYDQLRQRLERLLRRTPQVRFCVRIDAAGQYAANLERFLRGLPLPMDVSVGEPARNKAYRQAHFPKRKADVTDSYCNARYAVKEGPAPTPEVPPAFAALREVASQLQGQVRQSTRLTNQLHNRLARAFPELAVVVSDIAAAWVLNLLAKYPTAEKVARAKLASLKAVRYIPAGKAEAVQQAARDSVASFAGPQAEALILALVAQRQASQKAEKALEKLLVQAFRALPPGGHRQLPTILGIGEVTAAVLVAAIVDIVRFPDDAHLVSYFGIIPEENTSGVDKHGRPIPPGTMCMSRKGNDLVRKYLWMAAWSAIQCNPAVKAVYARQRAQGKQGGVAMGHAMRKIVQQVFAVWTTNRPFDPDAYPHRKAEQQAAADRQARIEKKAAGRKGDKAPRRQAVTATTSSIEPEPPASKKAAPAKRAPAKTPTVDFAALRREVTVQQILSHWGHFQQLGGRGPQRRGPCPLHPSERGKSRCFSVNLEKNVCQCFHPPCAFKGNVLDLWAAYHKLPLREAALHLAETFHIQLPRTEKRNP